MGAALTLILALAGVSRAEDIYEVKKADTKAAVGVKTTTSVIIAAKAGWHVNAEAPVSLKLLPDPGIAVAKPKLTRADLAQSTEDLARFDIAFTASEPGKKVINCEASFVMCQATTCKPVREKLALLVDVAASGAPKKSK
jgi:hypothetical protein